MSRKLAVNVVLTGPDGVTTLLAGDELPKWAEGRVGDHCFVSESKGSDDKGVEATDSQKSAPASNRK